MPLVVEVARDGMAGWDVTCLGSPLPAQQQSTVSTYSTTDAHCSWFDLPFFVSIFWLLWCAVIILVFWILEIPISEAHGHNVCVCVCVCGFDDDPINCNNVEPFHSMKWCTWTFLYCGLMPDDEQGTKQPNAAKQSLRVAEVMSNDLITKKVGHQPPTNVRSLVWTSGQ